MSDNISRNEQGWIEASLLSVRAKNALTKKGFVTLKECAALSEMQLLKIKNLGKKTVQEILSCIRSCNFENKNTSLGESFKDAISAEQAESKRKYLKLVLAIPISRIFFSVRAKNILDGLQVKCLKDLVVLAETRVFKRENCGKKTIGEIKGFLELLDLSFGLNLEPELDEEVATLIGSAPSPQAIVEEFQKNYPNKIHAFDAMRKNVLKDEKYERFYELYKEKGTLEGVAKITGVTRERVRQILVKGTKYGLFDYRGHEYPYVSKESLLSALGQDPNLFRVAKLLNISENYGRRLLASYGITSQKIDQLRLEKRKKRAIDEYRAIKDQLGHHPTTTELQYNKKWRPLSARIYTLWGTTDRFREEFDIPKPPQGNPRFRDDTRKWREERSQIALIKRMQRLDDIRDLLSRGSSANTQEISTRCKIKYNQVGRYINVLLASGEIIREGAGNQIKYRLANGDQEK